MSTLLANAARHAGRTRFRFRALQVRRFALPAIPSAKIVHGQASNELLELQWPSTSDTTTTDNKNPTSILSRQLRDFCACPQCRHPDTNQRLLDSFALPHDLHIHSAVSEPQGLKVTWSGNGNASGSADHGTHESLYSWSWLKSRTGASSDGAATATTAAVGEPDPPLTLWTSSTVSDSPPSVDYDSVMQSEQGVLAWIEQIRQWGFSFVDGCPAEPGATERLLERITFVRRTHYGDFWDFTADLASKDMAYTTLELGAHTDTTYFSDPAGLQMFHLLEHSAGRGGASLLVDGFRAAQVLFDEDPDAAACLAGVRVTAHATGNDDAKILTPRAFPVLEFRGGVPPPVAGGKVDMVQVRWNNDDRGSFETRDPDEIARWYAAAAKWNEIIRRPESQYWSQLKPGRPLIFDNWRVLHGRSAFTGKRRLCGGYLNMDDFLSRWRMLAVGKEELSNML